jgi:tRNA A-37 threonylcarbamoyl transferase component Bud32
VADSEIASTCRIKYAGSTAEYYRRLSEAGLAPRIVSVTDDEIETVCHRTLEDWLREKPSRSERAAMKEAIRGLLLEAHETGLCHRDAHIGNIVLAGARPLLIDPALAVPSVNEYCYDLEGPEASGVPVPDEHVRQGGDSARGVWWGSPVRHRSLEQAFGPLA